MLRSILWPIAILSVIHRSYVLATNGYITDDFGPVYRAVVNFKIGWDIYNEHFDHVDPHYLYPPGGTLLMAPFGYLPVDASRYWFIIFNTIAIVIAGYLLLRLFKFALVVGGRARPAAGDVLHRKRHQHTGVHQHQRLHPAAARCCSSAGCSTARRSHEWWAGVAIGLTLVVKPLAGAAAVAAAAEPAVAGVGHRVRRAAGVQRRRRGRWSATR